MECGPVCFVSYPDMTDFDKIMWRTMLSLVLMCCFNLRFLVLKYILLMCYFDENKYKKDNSFYFSCCSANRVELTFKWRSMEWTNLPLHYLPLNERSFIMMNPILDGNINIFVIIIIIELRTQKSCLYGVMICYFLDH